MPTSNSNFRVRNGIIVAGNSALTGNVVAGQNLSIANTLTVSGTLHTVNGNTNLGANTLHINATNKRAIVNGSSTSIASSDTDWAFEVVGKQRISSNLVVDGPTTINADVGVGNTSVRRALTVSGATTLQSNLTVTGNTTISGNSISLGSGTTPNTVIEGNVWIKGTVKTGAAGNYYDLDDLAATVGAVPVLKVYDVNGTQLFP